MAASISWLEHLHNEGCESFFAKPYLQNIPRYEKYLDRVKQGLDDEPWARRHPLMLLKGFLSYKLEESEKAIECFEDVLKEDPYSLNANMNLIFIYKELRQMKKREEYSKNIEKMSEDKSMFSQCILRARYQYAETMSMVDLHKQKQPGAKWVMDYYKDVLDDSKNSDIPQREMIDWQFGFAFLCLSIDSLYGKTDSQFYLMAQKVFYEIVSDKGNAAEESRREGKFGGNPEEYQKLLRMRCADVIPKSWCFLAALFSRFKREKDKLVGVDQNFSLVNCIEEAIRLGPKNPAVLRRAGQAYMAVHMMDEAKCYLEKALILEEHKYDYTFNLLGRWSFLMYEKHKGSPEEMVYLDLSINHYEKAVGMKTAIWHTYRNLAEVYFIKKDYIRAIVKCRMSEERGGQHDPRLYKIWGDCLQAQGEDAEGCRLKAERLRKGDFDINWKFGAIYCADDGDDANQIVSLLEKRCHVRGWHINRDVNPKAGNVFESSSDELEKCEYLLVFVSEKFLSKNSFAYNTLTSFILEPGKTKIVLILLKGIKKVPRRLQICKDVRFEESPAFYNAFKQLFLDKTTVDGLADLVEDMKLTTDSEIASGVEKGKKPTAESASKPRGVATCFPQQADNDMPDLR